MKNWKYIEGAKVGNYTPNYRYKGFLITNPEGYEYVVFLQDGIHVGYRGTTSKAQVEDWCDWHDPKTGKPVKNKKTGNESLGEYMAKKPRVINEEKTGAEEFFKKLSDDVKEREKKDDADIEKVGNAKEWDVKDSDVIEYIYGDPNATKLQKICEKNLGTYDTSKVQALLVDEKSNKWAVVKRGASAKMKVGNNSIGSLERELANLEKERKKIMDDKAHAIAHMEQVEISKCNQLLKENEEDKKYIIRKIAEEKAKSASASQLAKELDRLEKERRDISQKIFKARETMDYMEDALWKRKAKEKDEEIKQLKRQIDRLKVGNAKIGNSSSDDKFAYVMREFDEGKLKTPDGKVVTGPAQAKAIAYSDGKVVTDPAQAKAIAYSESKKTENGLARARNAIKKS